MTVNRPTGLPPNTVIRVFPAKPGRLDHPTLPYLSPPRSLSEKLACLKVVRRSLSDLLSDIILARQACGQDSRIQLEAAAFFEDDPRPLSGSGASASRNWMYQLTGAMVMGPDGNVKSLAQLSLAVQPRRKSSGRDLAKDPYCRFLEAIKTIAAAKSAFIASALSDPATPSDEVAEYFADEWRKLAGSGFPFLLTGNMAQKNLELSGAQAWLNGTAAQKESIFKTMFSQLADGAPLVCKCIQDAEDSQDLLALLGNLDCL